MKCPECGAHSRVISTRKLVVRRRICFNDHRFTTIEGLQKEPKEKKRVPRTQHPDYSLD